MRQVVWPAPSVVFRTARKCQPRQLGEGRFPSGYDFHPFTEDADKTALHRHLQTIQAIGDEYATRRKQAQRTRLRWRVSGGPRCSLGRIPFMASAIRYRTGQVFFAREPLSLLDSYGLSKYELGARNFSDDARGGWYLNMTIRVAKTPKLASGEIAKYVDVDLGLKDFAAKSDGIVTKFDRHYRKLEKALAKAQRTGRSGTCVRFIQKSKIP